MSQAATPDLDADDARRLLREGRLDEAERRYGQILEREPRHLEALNAVALIALRRGDARRSRDLLLQVVRDAPESGLTFSNLGLAQEALGDWPAALDAFTRALACDPGLDPTRLRQGQVLERMGRDREAMFAYLYALRSAQSKGRWRNRQTTAPELRLAVEQAIRHVTLHQKRILNELLDPLRARFGVAALDRVARCVSHYVGETRPDFPDPRQRPTMLYFPGIETRAYWPRERFPWIGAYEAQTAAIREELRRILPGTEGRQAVFHDERLARQNLRGDGGAPRWDAFYFYRHGQSFPENAGRCPLTCAAIEALPLSRVPRQAPEVMFSVLEPGTHLLPHRGVTNTRLVTHLPLIVPAGCALNVGGEQHAWREGEVVVFDDTYEHEAWNRGGSTRVILIADVWNPELTEAERAAVSALSTAIGDLGREERRFAGVPEPVPGHA